MSKSVIVIPARLASQRLAHKPLVLIQGKPLIMHVLECALKAGVGPVWVATCCKKIADVVIEAGGNAVLTDPDLPSGSDRVAAALKQVDPNKHFSEVINLQGDVVNLKPSAISSLLPAIHYYEIATPVVPLNAAHLLEASRVKVAVSREDNGLRGMYFSRAPIVGYEGKYFEHIGIYAYQRAILEEFVKLSPSSLEKAEKLEQLRAIEAGWKIGVVELDHSPANIDTPADLQRLEN